MMVATVVETIRIVFTISLLTVNFSSNSRSILLLTRLCSEAFLFILSSIELIKSGDCESSE